LGPLWALNSIFYRVKLALFWGKGPWENPSFVQLNMGSPGDTYMVNSPGNWVSQSLKQGPFGPLRAKRRVLTQRGDPYTQGGIRRVWAHSPGLREKGALKLRPEKNIRLWVTPQGAFSKQRGGTTNIANPGAHIYFGGPLGEIFPQRNYPEGALGDQFVICVDTRARGCHTKNFFPPLGAPSFLYIGRNRGGITGGKNFRKHINLTG